VQLAADLHADTVRYQGNWIPHALRDATEDEIFFAGDSAGHCLPLTAEGIRTALYFGLAAGRELRAVIGGEQSRAQALRRYHDFSAGHALPYRWMLRLQRLIPRVPPRVLGPSLRTIDHRRFIHWAFGRYLEVAHPRFVAEAARAPRSALTSTVRA
jgi:menaquinone-9 beta-reductase